MNWILKVFGLNSCIVLQKKLISVASSKTEVEERAGARVIEIVRCLVDILNHNLVWTGFSYSLVGDLLQKYRYSGSYLTVSAMTWACILDSVKDFHP